MERHGVEITLVADKCGNGLGHDVMGAGRLGSGARSWALCAFLTLLPYPQKLRIETAIVSEDP